MNERFESELGRMLYRLLPSVYRERDNPDEAHDGDLARTLDAAGVLLDRVRATLEQRLADAFPGLPDDGGAAGQDWLIPYVARLFDVRLVAPDVAGQRAEVQHAVAWRQRKGTLACAVQIARAILQREVVLQEGWQRVATTPRLDEPLLPAAAFGLAHEPDPHSPTAMASHPGLPAVTPDLRRHALALRTARSGTAVHTGTLSGAALAWLQAGRGGAPAHPGCFDDPVRRTVDLRTPAWNAGHPHPRRLLVFTPPPHGLFAPPLASFGWGDWRAARDRVLLSYDPAEHHLRLASRSDQPVRLLGDADLLAALTPEQRAALPDGDAGRTLPRVTIERIEFDGAVTLARGRLRAKGVAMRSLTIDTNHFGAPVLDAADSLFGAIAAARGPVRLDGCTVLHDARCGIVAAANTVFAGSLTVAQGFAANDALQLRRCRIPPELAALAAGFTGRVESCTTQAPVFFEVDAAEPFGPAAAVLSPQTPAAIALSGDGGAELGRFHRGRSQRPVHLRRAQQIGPVGHAGVLRDLVFEAPVTVWAGAAPLRLARCALAALRIETPAGPTGSDDLVAADTLFGRLAAPGRPVQLEHCTVLGAAQVGRLHASDCLFAGPLHLPAAATHCVRWSRVPVSSTRRTLPRCTSERPVFIEPDFARGAAGAEDGGEMGAGHGFAHSLQRAALADKLADHLPVGIEAVLLIDPQMTIVPPPEHE